MDLKDLIDPDHREDGLSCNNCRHLMVEYDLEARGKEVWVCNQTSIYSKFKDFPFKHKMPCFELPFELSIFAQNLGGSDESYEAALSKFTESLTELESETINPSNLH